MSVRKTETRLPSNHTAADLGQSVATGDGRCSLISFISSPLVVDRENTYVIFVTDAGLASSAQSFEWRFVENGGAPVTQTTPMGEQTYRPLSSGSLEIGVRVLGGGNVELATLSISQDVVPLNVTLEALINGSSEQPGPGVGNPETARELVNDHNTYYQSVELQTPEAGDGFKRFVFNLVYEGANQRTPTQRKTHLSQLADAINNGNGDFASLAAQGTGICSIRMALLAMSFPASPPLAWTEFPEETSARALADETLRRQLAALDENTRIDLFNLLRFPKSNINWCGRITEGLRNRYFAGTNFNDVITGMSGTRAHWINRHFKEGPIIRV